MPHRHFHHRRQHEDHDAGSNAQSLADSERQVAQAVESESPNVATVVSVQFITASKTFSGPAIGYTTIYPVQSTAAQSTTPVQSSQTVETTTPLLSSQPLPRLPTQSLSSILASVIVSESSSTPTVAGPSDNISSQSVSAPQTTSTSSANTDTTLLLNSISVTSPTGASVNTSPTGDGLSFSSQATAASAAQSSSSGAGTVTNQPSKGLTGGAKAGIAIGVILSLAALLGLLAFCYLRRKNQSREAHSKAEDEKNPFGDNAATPAPAPAPTPVSTPPHLSLRPGSQFHPEFAGQTKTGNRVAPSAVATNQSRDMEKGQSVANQSNPFDDVSNLTYGLGPHGSSAFTHQEIPAPLRIRTPTPEATTEAGVVAGAASATIAQRHNAPKPLDIKRSLSPTPSGLTEGAASSPAATEFSMTSTSPRSITNGAPPITNVHRIQLDFKPSMEDELELRAGQLVRLLHEYDDGWALCIRLDRSQQGVAPRTCLSTRPVKPRSKPQPRGPATGPCVPPQLRPMSPVSGYSSTTSSSAPPSDLPETVRGPQRSMSPGPYGGGPQQKNIRPLEGRRRSNSVSDLRGRTDGPPGPSPMNPNGRTAVKGAQKLPMPLQAMSPPVRKPVPAQTL